MSSKEAKARLKINKLLEDAGWRFFDSPGGKANISLEHRTRKGKTERIYDAILHISETAIVETATQIAPEGSLLVLVRGMGLASGVPICEVMRPCAFNQDLKAMHPKSEIIGATFLAFSLRQETAQFSRVLETAAHGTLKINSDELRKIRIPLPPLETQQQIVAELEQDLAAVDGAKRLKAKMEANIRAVIGRVWGEGAGVAGAVT